jgi:hypothetical protein
MTLDSRRRPESTVVDQKGLEGPRQVTDLPRTSTAKPQRWSDLSSPFKTTTNSSDAVSSSLSDKLQEALIKWKSTPWSAALNQSFLQFFVWTR